MMDVSPSSHWSEPLECVSLVLCNFPFHTDINLAGLPEWRCEWSVYRCRRHSALTRGLCVIGSAGSVAMLGSCVTVRLTDSAGILKPIEMLEPSPSSTGPSWHRQWQEFLNSKYPSVEPELIQYALLLLGHADKASSKEPVGCGYCCRCDCV